MFKMAAMTSFYTEKFCHLVTAEQSRQQNSKRGSSDDDCILMPIADHTVYQYDRLKTRKNKQNFLILNAH